MSPDEIRSLVASLIVFLCFTFDIIYSVYYRNDIFRSPHIESFRSRFILSLLYVLFVAFTTVLSVAHFRINNTTASFFLLFAWKIGTNVTIGFVLVRLFSFLSLNLYRLFLTIFFS
jgi:hypothetical protein